MGCRSKLYEHILRKRNKHDIIQAPGPHLRAERVFANFPGAKLELARFD